MKPSLHLYRHARLIVQNESTSATEAALAMRTNDIGCVLVTDGKRIVGIVTDRDLAMFVIGAGRDPHTTRLRDIMSSPVTTLDVDAPHSDAIRLMRERRIRRIPLLSRSRVVGMVTLDDLLLERTASLDDLIEIVRAQLVEGGPARTRRFDEWTSLARRHSRALGTKSKLLSSIRDAAELVSNDDAERALEIVLDAFVSSVDEDVRPRLFARLPVALRGRLREHAIEMRPPESRRELDERIAEDLDVDAIRAAEITDAVARELTRFVRPTDAIGRKLPRELRKLLASKARRGVVRRSPSRRPSARANGLRRTNHA